MPRRAYDLSPHRLPDMDAFEQISFYEGVVLASVRRDSSVLQGWLSLREVWMNLGMAYLEDFRYDEAMYYQNRALLSAQEDGDTKDAAKALVNLGIAHRYRGDPPAAIAAYGRAHEIAAENEHPEAIGSSTSNLVVVLDEQDEVVLWRELALRLDREAVRYDLPTHRLWLTRLLGVSLIRGGDEDEGRDLLHIARRQAERLGAFTERQEIKGLLFGDYSRYRERLYAVANKHIGSGRLTLAAPVLSKMLALPGCDVQVRLRVAYAYLASDQFGPAEDLFAQIVAEDGGPEVAELALMLSGACSERRRLQRAAEYVSTALKLSIRNGDAERAQMARAGLQMLEEMMTEERR